MDRLERAGKAVCGPGRDDVMHGMYGKLDPRPEGQWCLLYCPCAAIIYVPYTCFAVSGVPYKVCVVVPMGGCRPKLVMGSWQIWVVMSLFNVVQGILSLMGWVLACAGPRYTPEEVERMQGRALQQQREVGGLRGLQQRSSSGRAPGVEGIWRSV